MQGASPRSRISPVFSRYCTLVLMSGSRVSRLFAAFAFIVMAGASVSADWIDQRKAGPFDLRSEFTLTDEQGKSLVREMEMLKTDVEKLLAIKASDDPIQVNLFSSVGSYREHLSQRVPEGMSRPALFVKGADMS